MVISFDLTKLYQRLFGVAVMLMTIALSHAAGVEASLDRDSVVVGEGAVLSLKVTGGRAGRPAIPAVDNLIVNAHGQNQQIQIINGDMQSTLVYTYVVGSGTPGDYVIPPITVNIAGENHATQPLKLKVLEADAAQPGQNTAAEAEDEENRFGFLTVELANPERSYAYLGEIAPVRIRAWLPAGAQVQLRSGIQPEAKGFTLHNVSERPQQAQETRDGKTYTVVTWFGGISATKSGKLPASLSVDATVAVRDESAPKPRRRRGGPFDDPFFDDAFDRFNTPMIQKDVTLKSEDQEIEVRPLPVEGRPEGFNGAVGEFSFNGVRMPKEWKTGEPQQIAAKLTGSGNFALMKPPTLTPADGWKVYEGQDEFTPGDVASFSGDKVFQFNAVARKAGEKDAALAFSYFDPAKGSYQTITSPVTKIQVTGKDIVEDKPVAPAPEVKAPEKKTPGLVGQHLKQKPAASLVPLASRPVFGTLMALGLVSVVIGVVLALLRHFRENPQRRAKAAMEKATREALAVAGAARDVPGFFSAARLAIQQRLGLLWNQPPQAITTAEVSGRIPEDSPVVRFFREADRHEYSRHPSGEVLPQWRDLLAEALASLTPNAR
ncbi:protein BatD [Luteolibacter yonseiensis]|uniref:Protein BatD n=1 Tax=Luteolibacter yonseiensis TaxID=1144680 RepID=A0A934R0T3_9BACT|nr:BatD family protein [Luteolibacter yonseiensis]MBK1816288.1 protein BatD [Luteolibacter yonseiensis]